MPRCPWSHAETTVLVENPGASPEDLLPFLPGRTTDMIRLKRARMARSEAHTSPSAQSKPADDHPMPDFATPPPERVNLDDWLSRAQTISNAHGTGDRDKDYQRVVIETDEPIAVMMSADWHFGGLDVDYGAFAKHVHFLLERPGFYMQLVGDSVNLMNLHRTASARADILTVEEQAEFLHSFIHETVDAGKLLSVTSGNHDDEFTERAGGLGMLKLTAKHKVPYFRGHGYLDLVLRNSKGEEQTYTIALAHKTRFSSFMNKVHGAKRIQQMASEFFGPNRMPPRVIVTAHHHNPAMSWEGMTEDDRTLFIKCGTFKTDDTYSQRYFGQGRIGVPTVVFFPDRYEFIGMPTPWAAHRYITGEDWEG